MLGLKFGEQLMPRWRYRKWKLISSVTKAQFNVPFPFDTLNNNIKKNIFPSRKEIYFLRRITKPGAFPKPMPFKKMLLASCSILFISLYCFFVSIMERLGTDCGHCTSVSTNPGMFSLKLSTLGKGLSMRIVKNSVHSLK